MTAATATTTESPHDEDPLVSKVTPKEPLVSGRPIATRRQEVVSSPWSNANDDEDDDEETGDTASEDKADDDNTDDDDEDEDEQEEEKDDEADRDRDEAEALLRQQRFAAAMKMAGDAAVPVASETIAATMASWKPL